MRSTGVLQRRFEVQYSLNHEVGRARDSPGRCMMGFAFFCFAMYVCGPFCTFHFFFLCASVVTIIGLTINPKELIVIFFTKPKLQRFLRLLILWSFTVPCLPLGAGVHYGGLTLTGVRWFLWPHWHLHAFHRPAHHCAHHLSHWAVSFWFCWWTCREPLGNFYLVSNNQPTNESIFNSDLWSGDYSSILFERDFFFNCNNILKCSHLNTVYFLSKHVAYTFE